MKFRLLLLVGMVGLLLCVTAEAVTYRGTIRQVIKPFEDASGWLTKYERGYTFIGYYQYESDTIDGTFNVFENLTGTLFLPQPDNALYGTYGSWWDLEMTRNTGQMTVTDGEVESFGWSYEQAAIWSVFSTTEFFLTLYGDFYFFNGTGNEEAADWLRIEGSMTFGAPAELLDASLPVLIAIVPDAVAVLPCLTITLVGLLALRRKRVSARRSK